MPIWAANFLGMPFLTGIFLGVSFQNKAICNVFLMHSLIKYSVSTIYASNLLDSIKILYKFNNLVAHLCQHRWLQYIVLVFCWDFATMTGIFWRMPKIVGIFGVKIKVASEPMYLTKLRGPHPPAPPPLPVIPAGDFCLFIHN